MIPEMRFESEVRSEQRGLPISVALAQRFTYHSESEWQQKVLQGDVLCNGQVAVVEQRVEYKDQIVYIVRDYHEPEVPTHYEILQDDEEFLVVGKPAGVPVHHTGTIFYNTFTSILRRATGYDELVPMHRLDRDTSGVMLYAKSQDTSKRYQKSLEHIVLGKIYLAVVRGDFPEGIQEVQLPLTEKSDAEIRCRMVVDPNGKACHTRFTKLGAWTSAQGPLSVVQCELFTGRKHQIRAHLSALGHPIVGDPLYQFEGRYYLKRCEQPLVDADFVALGAHSQMLHAWKLELNLPGRRDVKIFESRLWEAEMGAFLKEAHCGIL